MEKCGILKITIKHSESEMGLVFVVDYKACFFACHHLSHH